MGKLYLKFKRILSAVFGLKNAWWKEEQHTSSALYRAKLIASMLDAVPADSIIYFSNDIYEGQRDGNFLRLGDFQVDSGKHSGYYDVACRLTPECIRYLKDEFSTENYNYYNVYYLWHWMIAYNDVIQVQVFDNCSISILESLNIPKTLIDEGKNYPEIYFYINNQIGSNW